MSLPLFQIISSLNISLPQGILQIGASYGQEIEYFQKNGISYGIFIEPLLEPFRHLESQCKNIDGYLPIQALCTDESDKSYTFFVASNHGMSSSILEPQNHLKVFESVQFQTSVEIKSTTLDEIIFSAVASGYSEIVEKIDTLFMDTQGSELKVLMGGNSTLKQIKYIYTEVMRADLYKSQPSFLSLCAWLDAVGYTLNNVYFNQSHWGDALFIRKDILGLE